MAAETAKYWLGIRQSTAAPDGGFGFAFVKPGILRIPVQHQREAVAGAAFAQILYDTRPALHKDATSACATSKTVSDRLLTSRVALSRREEASTTT